MKTSVPPGIQAEGSDLWEGLVEKLQEEMSIWLSLQPEFTNQQLRLTAMFGLHSEILWMIEYLLCSHLFLVFTWVLVI